MICFLVVLFFAVTGITLNHPSWVLGGAGSRTTQTGTMPGDWKSGTEIDWLNVSEFFRKEYSVKGLVVSRKADERNADISFKNPGYGADAFIDVVTGKYEITIESQGFLAVMNDLHKGRDSRSSWRWFIDIAAGFLVAVSLTGLLLQLVLRKRRKLSLVLVGIGSAITLILIFVATS